MPSKSTTPKKKKEHRASRGEGSLYLRGTTWWYKAPDGKCQSTGKRIKAEAIDWKLDFAAARRTQDGKPTVRRGIVCNEILDDYIAYLKLKGRKDIKTVEQRMNANIRTVFGTRKPDSLQTTDFTKHRAEREKDVSPTTVNRELSYFRAALKHGMKRQTPPKVTSVPYIPMADESGNIRTGFLDVAGYRKVLAELPPSIKPLFVCAYHVSSRKGELSNILWSQIDFDENVIILEHADTKNKTGRYLPIYGEMGDWLRKQQQVAKHFPDCPWVFFWYAEDCALGHGGVRVQPGSHIVDFRASWTAAVKRAEHEELLFHDLRRSATRNMRKAGIDKDLRMKISGQKTDSMERRYNIVDIEDVKEVGRTMRKWMETQ